METTIMYRAIYIVFFVTPSHLGLGFRVGSYREHIGIMEKKMDTTIGGLGFKGFKYTNTTDHGESNESKNMEMN